MPGTVLCGEIGVESIPVILGIPSAGLPCSSASRRLDAVKPLSVLTTCTDTTPSPSGLDAGTATVKRVEVMLAGLNGPVLIAPVAVATKKFTTDPAVNPLPEMVKLLPDWITGGSPLIKGTPGLGVGMGVGRGVALGVGVADGLGVADGIAGFANSSTRLSRRSAANRLPPASKASPSTPHSVSASARACPHKGVPISSVGTLPVVSGAG